MKRSIQAILGFGITGIFILLAIGKIEWAAVWASLASADYRFVVPAALVTLIGYGVRSLRWQQLLRPLKAIRLRSVTASLMLGFAANNVLPARVGELVRAHELGRREEVSRAATFTTILLERIFDGLVLLLVLGVVLSISPAARQDPKFQTTGYLAALIFFGVSAGLGLALWQEAWLLAIVRWVVRPLPARIGDLLPRLAASLLEGLRVVRSGPTIGRIALLSGVVWLCEGASYYLVLNAFHLPLPREYFVLAAALLVASVNLGIMVPSAPGYIGTFQVFAVIALGIFGVTAALALSIALVAHAMQYLLVTSIGLGLLLRGQSRRIWSRHLVARRHSG